MRSNCWDDVQCSILAALNTFSSSYCSAWLRPCQVTPSVGAYNLNVDVHFAAAKIDVLNVRMSIIGVNMHMLFCGGW